MCNLKKNEISNVDTLVTLFFTFSHLMVTWNSSYIMATALKWQIIPQLQFNSDGCETTYILVVIQVLSSTQVNNPNWCWSLDHAFVDNLFSYMFWSKPFMPNPTITKKKKERELDEDAERKKVVTWIWVVLDLDSSMVDCLLV